MAHFWGVAESASHRPLTGRNALCQTDGRTDTIRPCLQARVAAFGSQDIGFQDLGIWLWGPGFQDLDERTLGFTLRTWVSGPRKLSILRSSYLFPLTFLCVHRHFSPASSFPVTFLCVHRHLSLRAVVTDVRAGSAIENASRWSVIARAGSAVENASGTPCVSDGRTDGRTD